MVIAGLFIDEAAFVTFEFSGFHSKWSYEGLIGKITLDSGVSTPMALFVVLLKHYKSLISSASRLNRTQTLNIFSACAWFLCLSRCVRVINTVYCRVIFVVLECIVRFSAFAPTFSRWIDTINELLLWQTVEFGFFFNIPSWFKSAHCSESPATSAVALGLDLRNKGLITLVYRCFTPIKREMRFVYVCGLSPFSCWCWFPASGN